MTRELLNTLAVLILERCNTDKDSITVIQQRLYVTLRRGTYAIRFNDQEQIVGWCDYDCSSDGMLHIRKILALQPGVLTSLVQELKARVPWKRVFFYRSKYDTWRHHGRPWFKASLALA